MKSIVDYRTIHGSLRKNPLNPSYFTDDSGRAVYLTGSHTWANFQDMRVGDSPPFDYNAYLDFLEEHHHNFIRLWMWEQAGRAPWSDNEIEFQPIPYMRTGPGNGLDGGLKFNLDKWDDRFFERLSSRVEEAGKRGIYVSVMLFQGWSVKKPWITGNPWLSHPFNAENNINGVDGDTDADGLANIHSLECPAVVARQEAFIRKTVDTLSKMDNLLYEIINEPANDAHTFKWQCHMADYIHMYESGGYSWRPVGITAIGHTQDNRLLFDSGADWISPGQGESGEYKYNPPAHSGDKVIISDTDHLWGLGGDYQWVWKSFLRGLNPILMDPWFAQPSLDDPQNNSDLPVWEPMRRSLGYTLEYARRMDLNLVRPRCDLASTTFCLANPGKEYLVYLPGDRTVNVILTETTGKLDVEWLNPFSGVIVEGGRIEGGKSWNFINPFENDAVLYIYT